MPFIQVGNKTIPMYGICMALGLVFAAGLAYFRARRRGGDGDSLLIIMACAVGFGLVSAKLLYLAVSMGFDQVIEHLKAGDFEFIASSGQVFYGGLIGGVLGGFVGARIAKQKLFSYCDAVVPCVPLGHAFGRLGCFFAGCCYGMPYDGPFCVSFPHIGVDYNVFPVQLLEVFINLVICAYLLFYTRKERKRFHVLYHYLALYAVSRFCLELLRGDGIRGIAAGISTSQWISIGLLAVSCMLLLYSRFGKQKKA